MQNSLRRRCGVLVLSLACLLALFVTDARNAPSNSDTAKLIDECSERTTSMLGRIFDYGFTHTSTFRKRDKRGQVESEEVRAFEVYPVRGRKFAYILVSKDGEPIKAERVERDRKRVVAELTEAEERNAAQDTPYFGIWYHRSGKEFALIPTDFLRTHEFYAQRRANFNNREAVVFSFRPRPGADVSDKSGRIRAGLGGRVWIDAVDKVLMRLEGVPLKELSDSDVSPNANAPLEFELTRLPNGTWVPNLASLNTYGSESAFEEIKFDFRYRWSDFKLYSTSVDKVEIKPE